jgi:hypothetical protein
VSNMDAHVGAELVLVLEPLVTVLQGTQRTSTGLPERTLT